MTSPCDCVYSAKVLSGHLQITIYFPNVTTAEASHSKPCVGGNAFSSTKGGLLRYILNTYSIHKVSSLKFAFYKHSICRSYVAPTYFFKGGYPVTLLPPPRRLVPSLGLGTTWVRQLRSGSCHHPTAATKCNERPSRATANPVGGKACSSTMGGLLRYILNTYSIHILQALNLPLIRCTNVFFQGRLSRHITSPSEKTRPESWPGDYMGKATPF